jgi:ribosome assembly protein 1
MKASAICVAHRGRHLIALVDSPGHVDLSGEVGGAVRVTDGALLLVDAVEGVCIQTRVVLRQAWSEHLALCLVFTKVDKLFLLAKMGPADAYAHLAKLLDQVNAITATLRCEAETLTKKEGVDGDGEDDDAYFQPAKGNVIFSSSLHHWAFRTGSFAAIYAERLGMNREALVKALWGEFYLDPRTKRVLKKPPVSGAMPLTVQMVFKPIADVYAAVYDGDDAKTEKILATLKLTETVSRKDLASTDRAVAVTAVMSRWLPIGETVLDAVVEQLPSPTVAQRHRIKALLWHEPPPPWSWPTPEATASSERYQEAVASCCIAENAPVVAFVIKMFSLDAKEHAHAFRRRQPAGADLSLGGTESLISVARVFSGVLRPGQNVFVLNPRFDPLNPTQHFTEATVGQVFLLMG